MDDVDGDEGGGGRTGVHPLSHRNNLDPDHIDDNATEQELLKRLGQGQARMEQIKRMLVNQRGFIVEALKQLAESNSSNRDVRQQFLDQIREQKESLSKLKMAQESHSGKDRQCPRCQTTQDSADDEASIERDRTLGKNTMVNFGVANGPNNPSNNNNLSSSSEEYEVSNRKLKNSGDHVTSVKTATASITPTRLCPMCEVSFPATVTEEDFEMHVMEHFSFEETETLKYIPPENNVYN